MMTPSSVLIRLDWFCKESISFHSLSYLWKLTNSKNSILPRKFKYLTKKWNAIFLRFSNTVNLHFSEYFIVNKNLIYLQQKTSIRPKRRIFCSCLLHLLLVLFGVVIQCNSVVLMLWSGCPKLGGITCVMMWVGWIYRRYHRQTWQSWRQLVNHHYYLQLFKTWNG